MSLQVLADLRESQAAALSYFDDFWLFAVVPAVLVFLVLFMKRSVAEKGAHIRRSEMSFRSVSRRDSRGLVQRAARGRYRPFCTGGSVRSTASL